MNNSQIQSDIKKRLDDIEREIDISNNLLNTYGNKQNSTNIITRDQPRGDDPFEIRSFNRGKLVGLYIARDGLKSLLFKMKHI